MGYENGDNTGYILDGGGGGSDIDYGAAEGGDSFAVDYTGYYGGISPDVPEEIPYAPYEPVSFEPPTFEPLPQAPSSFNEDLYFENLDYYLGQRYDDFTADQLAQQAAAAGIAPPLEIGSEPMLPVTLAPTPILPEITTPEYILWSYQPWETPPYIPTFPEPPAPPPPVTPLPPSPATQQPNLPPYCPQGQYHPYPIGHSQQNVCMSFPTTTTQQQQQRQPSQQPTQAPSPSAPRSTTQAPRQQQPCPTGYKRDPWTLRCVPVTPQRQQQQQPTTRCATPGTVFDQATGRCVPQGQAVSPLPIPEEAEDMLSDLKKLPWWLWVALAGLLLLGSQGEERKRVTVQHRRAS